MRFLLCPSRKLGQYTCLRSWAQVSIIIWYSSPKVQSPPHHPTSKSTTHLSRTRPANHLPLDDATYKAIASTHARDNVLVEAPVYLLDGTKIADGSADMWDATLDALIRITEAGTLTTASFICKGSSSHGYGYESRQLGRCYNRLSTCNAIAGYVSASGSGSGWITHGFKDHTGIYPIYGLSEKLTVIPEPPAITLITLIGLPTVVFSLWKKNHQRHQVRRS